VPSAAGRLIVLAATGAALLLPGQATAQPWVLPEGEGSVSILYHQVFVEDHLFSRGEPLDRGEIRSHVLTTDFEYGLTDRLSVRALLPYVASKYSGESPHGFPPGEAPHGFHQLDDETYNGGFQDVRVEARYGWREFPVVIAPFVGVAVPTHDYEFFAHSSIGPNLAELQLGTYVGGLRGPFSFHGRLSFGIYEQVAGRRRNRSNIDADIGWMPGRRVRLSIFQTVQVSHGGVHLHLEDVLNGTMANHDWWLHHDQLGRANLANVGSGASVRLTPAVTVHGSVQTTVAGKNAHAAKYAFTFGATWGFGTPYVHRSSTTGR
jgi:hypothetical protein